MTTALANHQDAERATFESMLSERGREPGMLIPFLQAAQDAYGFVPPEAMERISGVTGAALSEIYGVVTFYTQFRLEPLGKHVVRVCKGTACHVLGAESISRTLTMELGVSHDQTTEDGLFTFLEVACLGCCSLAPAIMVDDRTYGRLTPEGLRKILRRYRRQAKAVAEAAASA